MQFVFVLELIHAISFIRLLLLLTRYIQMCAGRRRSRDNNIT